THHRDLHSFPTRRSSDLHVEMNKLPELGSNEKFCRFRGVLVQCGPWGLQGETDLLYHNRGDGTFEEVSHKAGVDNPQHYYGMGRSEEHTSELQSRENLVC